MKKVLFPIFALVLALGLALPMAAGAGPDLGIVGLWHLDEVNTDSMTMTKTTPDSSGQGNTGTLMPFSSEPSLVDGYFGKALSFNGTNYVDCGNVLNVTNKLTVEAWVKDSGSSGGSVVGKFQAYDKRWHIYINSGFDGKIYWNMGGWTYATSPTSDIGTDWHHLAMVYDGTESGDSNRLKAYIDGTEIALTYSGPIPEALPTIFANVNIGRHDSPSHFFKGLIDEVRIWDQALTPQQIALSYSGSANWLPPVTNADFALQDGTTLPLKFQLFDDSVLVTTEQPVSLLIAGPEGFAPSPLIFELGDGVENLRWNADEHYYIANLKTKVGTWPSGFYTASVLPANGAITFELSANKGVGRGNSGK